MLKLTKFLLIALCASATIAATPAFAQEAPESSPAEEVRSDVKSESDSEEEGEEKSEEEAPVEKKIPSNVRFFGNLNAKANATVGDGYRLAHILYHQRMNNKKDSKAKGDLSFYRDALMKVGVIDSEWSQREATLLTHVGLSYLLIKAAGIEGGVMWTLTENPRYAHREMVDRKLFPKVNPRQYITGGQALAAYRACRGYVVEAERRLTAQATTEPTPEPETETKPEDETSNEGESTEPVEGEKKEEGDSTEPKEDSAPEKEDDKE